MYNSAINKYTNSIKNCLESMKYVSKSEGIRNAMAIKSRIRDTTNYILLGESYKMKWCYNWLLMMILYMKITLIRTLSTF